MRYWKGIMNWPVDEDWECVVCGRKAGKGTIQAILSAGLTWGLVHGECRCGQCHTTYTMRPDGEVVTRPHSLLKEDWLQPAREAWRRWHKPLEELSETEWEVVGAPKGGG